MSSFRSWPTMQIDTPDGPVNATVPQIVSASRATDIPAFHSDWFFYRLAEGYCVRYNPFSGKKSYISFEKIKAVVFWTKNPAPMLDRVAELDRFGFCYYFQFTLNDYERERFEPNVPPLENRIETFRRLSREIGPERMVWRFDPIILSAELSGDTVLSRIKRIGNALAGYTQKLIISFADIEIYPKVRNNLQSLSTTCREPTGTEMTDMAGQIGDAARDWGITVASCCASTDLTRFGIERSRCVDPDLLLRLCRDETLYGFLTGFSGSRDLLGESCLNYRALKDKGQRKSCGCVWSKDVGQYNTCPHYCVYCYANRSKTTVERNAASFSATSEAILAENR